MKLKYNKQIANSIVTVKLIISNMTTKERKAIRTLGAPNIVFEETYDTSGTAIVIDTTLDKFNELPEFVFASESIDSIDEVIGEVNTFLEDIKDVLVEAMTTLMAQYAVIEAEAEKVSGAMTIGDGVCCTESGVKAPESI